MIRALALAAALVAGAAVAQDGRELPGLDLGDPDLFEIEPMLPVPDDLGPGPAGTARGTTTESDLAPAAVTAPGGTIRVLDKITGEVRDLTLDNGASTQVGNLSVRLGECRFPSGNPSGDAYVLLTIHYNNAPEPIFRGWMIASAPALNALDHQRYDVWALRCTTS
ncbi:DUF2155 domain-containing protein [Salibaculum sp.]|uniref:DUF2155 domain-containing protein n=1 Tax=Salibaculum sp. TaxID=2855480 RepID=UPI002B4A22F8|nr:DUF2155 domain-containing protein [Salibaculum sp.]HKL68277.1 DUF2155 domain-containing protein [Salibaculum sp.]